MFLHIKEHLHVDKAPEKLQRKGIFIVVFDRYIKGGKINADST